MKTYEEKYKEALENFKLFREAYKTTDNSITYKEMRELFANVENSFPELIESDDERLRKAMICGMNALKEQHKEKFASIPINDCIAWLEKQGEKGTNGNQREIPNSEQKLADKVEPKFKVEKDKWYVCTSQYGNCIEGRNYKASLDGRIVDDYGTEYDMHYDAYRWFRHWTIQDAKAGDVLSWDDSKCIALFKNIYDEESFNSYGFLGHCTGTFELRMSYHDIEGVHPATKEEKDLLFSKMKEAGYEWDAEKKELKKIEQKKSIMSSVNTLEVKEMDLEKEIQRQYEVHKNPDNNIVKNCVVMTKDGFEYFAKHFFELGLKAQPKQEWSEEDEDILNTIINHFEIDLECTENDDIIRWLKSLSPQKQWKPSEEQMKALDEARSLANNCGEESAFDLRTLHEQLKKLREE